MNTDRYDGNEGKVSNRFKLPKKRWIFTGIGVILLFSMVRFENPMMSVETVSPIIKTAMKDMYEVEKTFKARSKMTGIVVHKKDDIEDKTVFFMTPDKKTMIAGQLFDEKGDNASEALIRANVDVDRAMKHLQDKGQAAQMNGVPNALDISEDVLKDAPGVFAGVSGDVPSDARILYVFADPNCVFCHRMFEAIAKNEAVLKELNVRVKWIPVAVLVKDDSEYKAEAIIKGGYDAFMENETKYNSATHRGGVTGINEPQYFELVKSNTKMFMSVMPNSGTPAYVWFKDGKIKRNAGALGVDKVREFIEKEM